MFIDLFNEDEDIYKRISTFKKQSADLLEKYGNEARQHYQNENAISVYLWLRFPDRYYIYKYGEIKSVSDALSSSYKFKKGRYADNLQNFYSLYNEICQVLKQDNELVSLLKSQITEDCYPDPELKTLTIDVGFYISRHWASQKDDSSDDEEFSSEESENNGKSGYWWLNASWSPSSLQVGKVHDYPIYCESGRKVRLFQNYLDARVGDPVIVYECSPIKQVTTLMKVSSASDGQKVGFEKTESLSTPIDLEVLREYPELQNSEIFKNANSCLLRLTKDEFELIMDIIRNENPKGTEEEIPSYTRKEFLSEVYMTEDRYTRLTGLLMNRMNIILQGAPGVGKTFAAKRLCYSLIGKKDDSRIEFVQFHQNYSYEDFMMGYRPSGNSFELKYGIFYRFCKKAENNPDKKFFFIIDEINRGNLSRIFGELLMLIEKNYRGTSATLAYNGQPFAVPDNLYIIGMMNTADRSLAMIDYALRRRFSFLEMNPGFESEGFRNYRQSLENETFDELIQKIIQLNDEIRRDKSLGKGFCIGHSYFCGRTKETCTDEWMQSVVDYDILPMLSEYWFDDDSRVQRWENILHGVFND